VDPMKLDLKREDAKSALKSTGKNLSTLIHAILASTKPTNRTAKKQPRIIYALKLDIFFASTRNGLSEVPITHAITATKPMQYISGCTKYRKLKSCNTKFPTGTP
jgi:hypothetical protein